MSSRTENQTSESAQAASPVSSAGFPDAIFLMINSLETGGTERQFIEIARSLKSGQYDVRLGCLQRKGSFLESPGLDGPLLDGAGLNGIGELQHFGLGGSLYGLQSMRSRWRLMRYLRRSKTAVAQAFDFYANLVLIPAARLAGVPVLGSHRQLGDLLTRSQFRVQLEMFRWCDKVVCNSRAAAERLAQAGLPTKKLVVIGNGMPPSVFAAASPDPARLPGVLRIGMIARMNQRAKNHSLFLRAAARVSAKFSAVEFVLVGDGPLHGELEQQVKDLGLLDRVRFLGDRRDIPSVLASLDITVLPSASESLSNAVMESMAAGIPVIASRVGGNPELITGERGVLVTADDEQALSAAMESVLRDQDLRTRLGHNARAYALANFTIDKVRKQYEELYVDLIQRKGA
jgi:glycosyltransferase involved in cell wall biosynthesis